jgi:hypothetical protein
MLLSPDPGIDEDIFAIVQINGTTDYITLLHANGKTQVQFLPADVLIKNDWWTREHDSPVQE